MIVATRLLRIAASMLAIGMISVTLLVTLSPNIVYVRTECYSLSKTLSYQMPRKPLIDRASRRVYIFTSHGNGSLLFRTGNHNIHSFGYLTGGMPSIFFLRFRRDCKMTGSQWLII